MSVRSKHVKALHKMTLGELRQEIRFWDYAALNERNPLRKSSAKQHLIRAHAEHAVRCAENAQKGK